MKSTGQKITIWIGWTISLLFIIWAVAKMDLVKVWDAILVADYRWFFPAAMFVLFNLYLRGERWRQLIAPIKEVSSLSSLSALCIGFMANMVLPARIGEFVRAYALAKKESIPKSSAFATVVLERAFDGLSVVVMMVLVFALVDPPDAQSEFWNSLRYAGISASIFFVVFFAGLYLFHKRVKVMVWLVDVFVSFLPGAYRARADEVIESFRKGFESIDHGHRLAKIIGWSALIWGLGWPLNYFTFMAFDLNVPLAASFLVLLSQIIGVMIPSAPGFIGVYHAATMAGLMFYGVDAELALSVALVAHIIMFSMQIIPGLVFLWMEQYSIKEIQNGADDES